MSQDSYDGLWVKSTDQNSGTEVFISFLDLQNVFFFFLVDGETHKGSTGYIVIIH